MTVYTFADPERAVVDYLTPKLADRVPKPDVGIFYPKSSTDAPAVPYVQVGWDGTPVVEHPITQFATVRITVWDANPTPAKALAFYVMALLLDHPGDNSVWSVVSLTGPAPTRDPDTGKWLVTFTVRVSVRPSAA